VRVLADPDIDYGAGTATLDYDDDTNWTLVKMEMVDVHGGSTPSAILAVQNYDFFGPLDATPLPVGWKVNDFAVRKTVNDYIRTSCWGTPIGAPSDSDRLRTGNALGAAPDGHRIACFWFYDDGHLGAGHEHAFTLQTKAAAITAYGIIAFGWDTDDALATTYLYQVSAGGWQDTGVTRAEGWHKVVMVTDYGLAGDEFTDHRIWLDGVLEYTASEVTPPDPGLIHRWRVFSWNVIDGKAADVDLDEVILQRGGADLFEVGTATIDITFSGPIDSFDGVTIVESDTGAWSGTIANDFAHDDGGGFGAFQTLNDTNLQALTPGATTNVLRVRLTHTPDSTAKQANSMIPKSDSIVIDFTPGAAGSLLLAERSYASTSQGGGFGW
jgi:hypothetical protein